MDGFQADLAVFFREQMAKYDPSIATSDGSEFDLKVLQPLLRRVGSDPFSIDTLTFLQDSLTQSFPQLSARDGDALYDGLIKPMRLFLAPVIREINRIKSGLSMRDPATLTLDEADALGANAFLVRDTGDTASGTVRMYFSSPQNVQVAAANYFSSKSRLRFFATGTQSITKDEMLLNKEGSYFYFDVSVVAEQAGDEYNVEPDEIASVFGLSSVIRVTNKRRFSAGRAQEDAVTFVRRVTASLSEKSLVTEKGISATLPDAFRDIVQLRSVGFGDPEMQRDVLSGGGLGPLLASGVMGEVLVDMECRPRSRRVRFLDAATPNLLVLAVQKKLTATLAFGRSPSDPIQVKDYPVRGAVSADTLDLEVQELDATSSRRGVWMLRERSLTLTGIPGGILFPTAADGTLAVRPDELHIGGCTDIYLRGSSLEYGSLQLFAAEDEEPELEGQQAFVVRDELWAGSGDVDYVTLRDFEATRALFAGGPLREQLERAVATQQALRIIDGPFAGTYPLRSIQLPSDGLVHLGVDGPTFGSASAGPFRWALVDRLTIDLNDPKVARMRGDDLRSVAGQAFVESASVTPFASFGVVSGDTLEILGGVNAGTYEITAVAGPFGSVLTLAAPLARSQTSMPFVIFRRNAAGVLTPPLVRVQKVSLMDNQGQPLGVDVPYGRCLGAVSEAFANQGNGIKVSVADMTLGLVGDQPAGAAPAGTLRIDQALLPDAATVVATINIVVPAGTSPASLCLLINQRLGMQVAFVRADGRLAIAPLPNSVLILPLAGNSSAFLNAVFGSARTFATNQAFSQTIVNGGGWAGPMLQPSLDDLDVLEVLTGTQQGVAEGLRPSPADSRYLLASRSFFPETGVVAQVGSRSLGTARLYFLDPTYAEAGPETQLVFLQGEQRLLFRPDPANSAVIVPAPPSGKKPGAGFATATNVWQAAPSGGVDFFAEGVRAGDLLVPDYLPIVGLAALDVTVVDLHGKQLLLSVDAVHFKPVTFVNDNPAIGPQNVSRSAVATQINQQFGSTIASVNGSHQLELVAGTLLVVHHTGSANAAFGFSAQDEIANTSTNARAWRILSVPQDSPSRLIVEPGLALSPPPGSAMATYCDFSRHQYQVVRPQMQRISPSEMAENTASGLYYWDVQLVSQGCGDRYNLTDRSTMTVEGLRVLGYELTNHSPELSFSTEERLKLRISPYIYSVGANLSPSDATPISGANLFVEYERSPLVASVSAFITSRYERVTNASLLARHLLPHFLRFSLKYAGSPKESEVRDLIYQYVAGLAPSSKFEVSDIEQLLGTKGVHSVQNPVDLIALVHGTDRAIRLQLSQDYLTTTDLSAFFIDDVELTRTGW